MEHSAVKSKHLCINEHLIRRELTNRKLLYLLQFSSRLFFLNLLVPMMSSLILGELNQIELLTAAEKGADRRQSSIIFVQNPIINLG